MLQAPQLLVRVHPIPDDPVVRDPEPEEVYVEVLRHLHPLAVLVAQHEELDVRYLLLLERLDEAGQCAPGVDEVLDDEDVLALELGQVQALDLDLALALPVVA